MRAVAGPHYRWVVLVVSVLVNITIQLQWIALSPVSATAAAFYGVSTTYIGYFSIVFMVVFIPLSIPAAWLVDRYGIRFAVGIGAVAVAVGGILRGLAGHSYAWAMAATVRRATSWRSGLRLRCVTRCMIWVPRPGERTTEELHDLLRDADDAARRRWSASTTDRFYAPFLRPRVIDTCPE